MDLCFRKLTGMNDLRFSKRQFLYCVTLCVICAGCSPHNLPGDVGTVIGNVSYNGEPVPAESVVIFVHTQTGIIGTGVTDANGDFQILMREGKSVLVGDYSVNLKPPGELEDDTVNELTMETVPDAWKLVPEKYWTQTKSKEKFTVKQGENDFEWKLTD